MSNAECSRCDVTTFRTTVITIHFSRILGLMFNGGNASLSNGGQLGSPVSTSGGNYGHSKCTLNSASCPSIYVKP